jgi:hypothetical protein
MRSKKTGSGEERSRGACCQNGRRRVAESKPRPTTTWKPTRVRERGAQFAGGVLSAPSGTRTIPSQTTKTSESSGFFVVGATQNSQGPLIGRTSSTTVRPLIHPEGTEQPQRRSKSPGPRRTGATPRCCDHDWRTAPRPSTRGGQNPRRNYAPASPAGRTSTLTWNPDGRIQPAEPAQITSSLR